MHSEANEVQDQASESLALTGLEGALALWYALVVWFVKSTKGILATVGSEHLCFHSAVSITPALMLGDNTVAMGILGIWLRGH